MRGRAIDEQIRDQVVAAVLAGLGVSEIARQYHLPKSTVSRIRNEVAPERLEQVGTEHRARLDDLLLSALSDNLTAQSAIAKLASDQNYLRGYGPSAVAELYTALADKAVRLLEAASWADDPAERSAEAAP